MTSLILCSKELYNLIVLSMEKHFLLFFLNLLQYLLDTPLFPYYKMQVILIPYSYFCTIHIFIYYYTIIVSSHAAILIYWVSPHLQAALQLQPFSLFFF